MKNIVLCISLLLVVAWSSCGGQKGMNVKFTFTNSSKYALDWVKLQASKGELTAGILSPGISKTEVNVDWASAPKEAKLTFVDDKTRQRYTIPLSLTNVNQQVRSGKCREVVIRILDYDKAEILCNTK